MSNQNNKLASKKSAVLEDKKRKIIPTLLTVVFIVAVLGITIYSGQKEFSLPLAATESEKIAEQITFPLSMFDHGRATHFKYQYGSVEIRYFILKSSDGVVRAAFDACDVCWPSGKGYYQDGDYMVCANCGKRFASVLINEVRGGCNPEPLARQVSGENLVIEVEDILTGKKYFAF